MRPRQPLSLNSRAGGRRLGEGEGARESGRSESHKLSRSPSLRPPGNEAQASAFKETRSQLKRSATRHVRAGRRGSKTDTHKGGRDAEEFESRQRGGLPRALAVWWMNGQVCLGSVSRDGERVLSTCVGFWRAGGLRARGEVWRRKAVARRVCVGWRRRSGGGPFFASRARDNSMGSIRRLRTETIAFALSSL